MGRIDCEHLCEAFAQAGCFVSERDDRHVGNMGLFAACA